MAKYVMLVNWTDQGIRNVKDTVTRAKAARKAFEAHGVKMGEMNWTLGQYDMVLTAEAPNDETITKVGLSLGASGNVRSTTLRAFDEAEMEAMLKSIF